MARVRTVDFLPEIFQTSTNRQFLSATLDQLVQEPAYKKIQGFVGRRTGPGVNPNDKYVAETTTSRANYQLETGVIIKQPESEKIQDAITYPGILDALGLQGAITDDNSRLFTSDYYTWDPFVDFDKFVNFSQYYWLPAGPNSVDVFAESVPTTDTFDVTRANGVYTFSGINGNNPALTLVRGGSYSFNVAQNEKETVNYRVSNQGTSGFLIDYELNPTLTLVRGNTYVFNLVLQNPYPFCIKTTPTLGRNDFYNTGVTNNGEVTGQITFVVPQTAPDTLYYTSITEPNLLGTINIIDATSGTGPGFWIQTDPGIDGKIPATPNISSRDVLGVANNGEDLGTVTFNVPLATAQSFYYSLTPIADVDLIVTGLTFEQINNQFVVPFLETTGGIDGITELDGKTIIFADNPETGWERDSQFDPIESGSANTGLPGTFDTLAFDQTTPVLESDWNNVWQIRYQQADDGLYYMTLVKVVSVNNLEKFNILYGTQWADTGWYKTGTGQFAQIPLLTAIKDVLYYQDGTDPEIFGPIKLINQDQVSTLDIDDIIGKKNYTSPNGVVFTNGLKVQFIGDVVPLSYKNNEYYVEGVGTAIKLLPVTNYVTPETYNQSETVPYDSLAYDVGNYDASLNQPIIPEYFVINRASPDLSPWARGNRWFHIDVINASAEYNNTIPVLNNQFRAKRPILEYRAGLRLFDFGTQGKQPIDIIDFSATDALSTINGTIGYGVDGYNFINGSRVIFAADTDPQVRNKIYTVEFIVPDTVPPLIAEPIINLVPAEDATVLIDQSVVCLSGVQQQGKSFYFDGVTWIASQQKTKINQPPLFDVYDLAGVSFGNRAKYPSTNFTGSKLFSYKEGTGTKDTVLGIPLTYLSLANVGDIVFENNLYTSTFIYTKDNVSTTENISTGFVKEYADRTVYNKQIGWKQAITKNITRQQFKFSYDGTPLQLDVKVNLDLEIPGVQLYVGTEFQDPTNYTVTTTDNSTKIVLNSVYVPGDIIEVDVISDQVSKYAFYNVPKNLQNNPLNENSPQFTLGTVRSHYETIAENLKELVGPVNGANNTRDLGDIGLYGTNILQQSSPLTLAGYFMRSKEYNIFAALNYNSQEYEKFKAQLLDTVVTQDYTNYTVPEMLTAAITYISSGRTNLSPFYWTDMLPANAVYTQTQATITPISTNTFDLNRTYDFTSSNYQSVLVYVNDILLTSGYEYVVSTDGPRLEILISLSVGDVVTIQEFDSTYGTFVPNTPTKLGLYPAFKPEIYIDTTYLTPTPVIRGHDGSITVAFGDFRDQLLLEFETRIYNNLKIKSKIPLNAVDVIPGQFRTTDYTLSQINQILAPDFLTWVGWNKLNYQQQDYIATNEFTWNYSAAGNKLTGNGNTFKETALPVGAWRGIYRYFYDTDYPASRPWEMLGFSEEPVWWEEVYGIAPFTQNNLVLWDDLAQGRVADPAGEYFLPQYARPRLQEVIPTGDEGQLLSPFDSVVGAYDSSQFQKSWIFGDGGPVEAAWFKSSSYPFAIMRLLALTRPAEFFALFADRDLYKYDEDFNQYLYNDRYRLDANGVQVYGNGTSKASYINWIVDYNQQLGKDSTTALTTDLSNLDVRLCYRMGGFTDKQYLKIFTEKSSPNSLNSSLLLPDESYNLLLYKNQPFDRITYSSVIVQRVGDGYAVYGYSITNPYFNILTSRTSGTKITLEAGGNVVRVPNEYSDNVVQVPYGYVFANTTVVVDFLLSYGALLERQGLTFSNVENGYLLNWKQMAQEFLYWAGQGWAPGAVINLNPSATSITAIKPLSIVDSVIAQTPENLILDQNRSTLPVRDLVVDRYENVFTLNSVSSQTISYLDLRFTNYESMVVLDNVSIFNDLIYDPVTGARQSRINVSAALSAEWNGQLDAQGFILNNNSNVQEWQPDRKYAKGEIVSYKNNYWSAQTIIQPNANFQYDKWVKSDYTKIQGGLLQNISNKSDQLANSYNTNDANLETDQDLLSYGLIGFRPREYMTALNLDDVSQVNLYQQFLKDKGTIQSVQLLGTANLGKEVAEYNLYENWAIQRATYGANANRSFIELQLNAALLKSDPSLVQVVNPQQTSTADQSILLSDVWRQSYKLPNTNIFPLVTESITDTALPSAGYVNFDDADITVFSLLGNLTIDPAVLETIGIGTTIWAAKVNSYDWDIYRCSGVPGNVQEVSSNLNSTSTVLFSQAHKLSIGDIVIIRFFDTAVNGIYRVLAVPDQRSIVIELSITKTLTGQGVAYFLQTMRVDQASDAINLPYVNELVAGARIWVDNNGAGLWTVLEKQSPFVSNDSLTPSTPVNNSQFGASITQGTNNLVALVGSPGYVSIAELESYGSGTSYVPGDRVVYQGTPYLCILSSTGNLPTNATYWEVSYPGAAYPYFRDADGFYTESNLLTLGTASTSGYGNAVDIGGVNWGVIGASLSRSKQGYACVVYRADSSNTFEQKQLLVSPDKVFGTEEFGTSLSISKDERWIYVGAPGDNKVHAYGLVQNEFQSVKYIGDGVTNSYTFNGLIEIDNDNQLNVIVNNRSLQLNIDYSVLATNVVLNEPPFKGQSVIISRKISQQLDHGVYYNIEADSTSGSGINATFTVARTRGTYSTSLRSGGSNYNIGDTLTIDAATIGGGSSPANDLTITVDDIGTGGVITAFTPSGSGVDNTTTFNVSDYLYTASNEFALSITVDGDLQRPDIDYTYTSGIVTFINNPPAGATIFALSSNYFDYVDTITVAGLPADARFGQSVATTTDGRQLLVGCSADDVAGAINGFLITGEPAINFASYINVPQASTSGVGYGAIFDVVVAGGVLTVTATGFGQGYQVGDTITLSGALLGGTSPVNDITLTVTSIQNLEQAGSVFAFDRNVIRYIVEDATETEYAIPAGSINPVSVLLNNQFLTNDDYYINGQYTVDLLNNTITLTSNVELNVGDVLEIETNQIRLVQEITASTASDYAEFGKAVDICPNNCSVYIGAPSDSLIIPKAGSVDRRVNQSRIYGTTTSVNTDTITVTAGDSIRINNTLVEFTLPSTWNINSTYTSGTIVNNSGSFYVAVRAVPAGTAISDTSYWTPGSWIDQILYNIEQTNIPNIVASKTPVFENAQTVYYRLNISVTNLVASDEFNRLTVLPGPSGSAFTDIGFDTYAFTQTIYSPNPTVGAQFGSAVFVDSEGDNLVVGAPNGDIYEPVTFDNGTTYFDDRSTIYSSTTVQSGVVYEFDYLPSANSSINNPGKFIFGQQIYDNNVKSLDQWGAAVNYTAGKLLIGSPGSDVEDSTLSELNYGRVAVFRNPNRTSAWVPIHTQQPVVDVHLLNSVFMFDKLKSSKTYFFDFFDPLQGKILGAAQRNIDYLGAVDPAKYNAGLVNNNGNYWTTEHIGQIWWDTNSVRFIDSNQDDITYASQRWGQVFPGSQVEVYQWIESTVPPVQYTGPGTPYSTTSYAVNSRLSTQGIFETLYYFWVTGLDTIALSQGKTLSTNGIARYIESPRSSGIPYVALLNQNTVAIYNGLEYINAQDTILHIEYDREFTTDNVHVEYQLITQDKPESFLSTGLYRKLLDSFCGVNETGALVPDPNLAPAERYGVQFRPRQSMFIDRFEALRNYLVRANNIIVNYPIVETNNLSLLNSQEPEPTSASGEWNKRLLNIEELSYQNLDEVPLGYKYLVVTDSTNNGLWTIYTVINSNNILGAPRTTLLTRVQTYDTRRYWYHVDWYQPGYNKNIVPVAEVANYSALEPIAPTIEVGESVKVTSNAQGKFEIYIKTITGWDRVALQDGTLQFSEDLWDYTVGRFGFDIEVFDAQYFDQEPTIETRKILQAINEELFIGELAIERNRSLILMFNYMLTEFQAPEWLVKTSLVDVTHKIRDLVPFQVYRQDNQEFVLDYIQEVKPYHVQIKEFNLSYNGRDQYAGMMTDFDIPAYYNTNLTLPQYVSPILLPYTKSDAVSTGTPTDVADTPSNAELWATTPWNEWFNNYTLSVEGVTVIEGGSGYFIAPTVVVTGDCDVPAELTALVNSAGKIVGFEIVNPGSGYLTTPTITFTDTSGVGAKVYPLMGNNLVRQFKTTIKYDRYQYQSTIVDWQSDVNYENGTLVRYDNRVWEANSDDSTGVLNPVFDPDQWTLVGASTLSGVDRTQGFYTPTANEPGIDLPLLIDGLDYPGVQVFGPLFSQNTGFDVGNFDINPYDNISYGPEGQPTYDPAILDAIYESAYLDPYFGTLPAPAYNGAPPNQPNAVVVSGGEYVDTYSSHAPEELIPGAEFDTLDLRVYTRPGSDWAENGHGFVEEMISASYINATTAISFAGLIPYPVQVIVTNQTTQDQLYPSNYTIDWENLTVVVTSQANPGDIIVVYVYGLGGGNQLYRDNFLGSNLNSTTYTVPVMFSQIQEFAIFVNGVYLPQQANDSTENYSYAAQGANTLITFSASIASTDYISLTAIGVTNVDGTPINYSWSTPTTQYILGETGQLSYALTNSLLYTNPVNLIVTVNGVRARTAAGVEYYGDGSSAFILPERLGFSPALISNNDVYVYINDIPLIQGVDYIVEPYTGDVRRVEFTTPPSLGERILISVKTQTQCWVDSSGDLIFDPTQGLIPNDGDTIAVTTWNDTRQQNILTTVYVGPITTGVTVTEGYDDTDFDSGTVNNDPGSFDYAEGVTVTVNDLQLGRTIVDASRLWVTLNGARLIVGQDFTINGEELVLSPSIGVLSPIDVVMITEFTDSLVPDAIAFRIFQDMRGVQATYRITPSTTTTLVQPLSATADIMYVENASALGQPALNINIWGVLTVNGERIMYRDIDYTNNTVSGLRRGTAGTAAASHSTDSIVYNLGRGDILPVEYQDFINSNTFIGDSTTTSFTTDIIVDNRPIVYVGGKIEVYLNTVLQLSSTYTVTKVEPVAIDITNIPRAGTKVLIKVIDALGNSQDTEFTATGSSGKFVTDKNIGLVEVPADEYVLDDFEPVIVTFNSIVPDGRCVYIRNQRGAENEFDYSFSNGVSRTFTTNINLSLPVRTYVGGFEQAQVTQYNVISLNPVIVQFIDAPPSNEEVTILVRQGVTWYESDGVNPSNGVALQDTNTKPARFLRGL